MKRVLAGELLIIVGAAVILGGLALGWGHWQFEGPVLGGLCVAGVGWYLVSKEIAG